MPSIEEQNDTLEWVAKFYGWKCLHIPNEVIYNSGHLTYFACTCRFYVIESVLGHTVHNEHDYLWTVNP